MIKTSRLNLRNFTKKDLPFLYQLHSNPEVAKTTIDGVQNLEVVKKHLNDFIAHQEKFGFSQMAVFENESGNFIGRAGLTKRALNQEIGEQTEIRFALLPEFWGFGYASEICKELIRFGFEDLGAEKLAAAHGANNHKSERILTKNGFCYLKTILLDGRGSDSATKYYLITRDSLPNIYYAG